MKIAFKGVIILQTKFFLFNSVWNNTNKGRDTPSQDQRASGDKGQLLHLLRLGQKAALKQTAKTTADGELACTFNLLEKK